MIALKKVLSYPMTSTHLWHANIHYHSLLVEAIPQGARRVLDVGCGDGILSAHLIRSGIPHVIGLDVDWSPRRASPSIGCDSHSFQP